MNYDSETDVLYVTFGSANEVYSRETLSGAVMHFNQESGVLVGVSIPSFARFLARMLSYSEGLI